MTQDKEVTITEEIRNRQDNLHDSNIGTTPITVRVFAFEGRFDQAIARLHLKPGSVIYHPQNLIGIFLPVHHSFN